MTTIEKAIVIALGLVLEMAIAFAAKLGAELASKFIHWLFKDKGSKGKKSKHRKKD